MHFLRKKRRKKDLAAGLIFHWRGAKKHHMGKVLALMITIGFFAFSVYALKIETLQSPLLSQRKGVVIILNEDDPYCRAIMIQIDGKSPFPVRWDPALDPDTMARIESDLNQLQGPRGMYQPELDSLPVEPVPRGLSSVRKTSNGLLGDVMNNWEENPTPPEVEPLGDLIVSAKMIVGAKLKARLYQDELSLPPNLVADDSFGQSFVFSISLDAKGILRSCIPLPGGTTDALKTTERQKNLAAWLRVQKFKPAEKGGEVTGKLELQIKASRE